MKVQENQHVVLNLNDCFEEKIKVIPLRYLVSKKFSFHN